MCNDHQIHNDWGITNGNKVIYDNLGQQTPSKGLCLGRCRLGGLA
jgi:hypothetical protein